MSPRIKEVTPIGGLTLRLIFSDETVGEVQLRDHIVGRGGVFTPLEGRAFFDQVRVDQEVGTIVWPNDVDLDPDVLYSLATGAPLTHETESLTTHGHG